MEQSDPECFRVHEVSPGLRVRVTREMAPLTADLDAEVEDLWQTAVAQVTAAGGPALFNGRVFSADTFTPTLISGHMTEFRRVVAQMRQPALFAALRIRPLAVCGVLQCADGIVAGRRPSSAVYQAGMWQLPPAGSVDAGALRPGGWLDTPAQLLTELKEELGLANGSVTRPEPLCIVEHPGSHVADLGMMVRTGLSEQDILSAHAADGNGEYASLRVIALDELPRFVAAAGASLVPSAAIYLTRLGLLEQRSHGQAE